MDNSKQETFDPAKISDARVDPLSPPTFADFDWQGLESYFGEAIEVPRDDREKFAVFLGDMLRWINAGEDLKVIGRRSVAFAWTLNPAIFDGLPITVLAQRFGYARGALSRDTAEISRRFRIRNHSQDHAWNFKPEDGDPAKN